MINRILLRIKILQILFSYYKGGHEKIEETKSQLALSVSKAYDMYFLLLRLSVDLCDTAYSRREAIIRKRKMAGRDDFDCGESMPPECFYNNKFAKILSNNKMLCEGMNAAKVTWLSRPDLLLSLYKIAIEGSTVAKVNAGEYTEGLERRFIRDMLSEVVHTSDFLNDVFEEMSIYWNDDIETVLSFVLKTLNQMPEDADEDYKLMPMYRDEEDMLFGEKLLTQTIYKEAEIKDLISRHLKNWTSDRVAFMDMLIMQMALTEITTFTNIPVNVSISEYIELAKYYSTEKSSTFVNAVLDSAVKELKAENKLTKVVYLPKS